ncbi:uncharacterized protein LODBEIA_P32070 [Lodderomyces beijingensis]|uniref:ATPase expression protein 2, mitochondrial n=1 Tax=Lodderomyces beijingensis TaxID=1775926 RepID=A0ABP0ZLF1_9ASCO
MFRLISSHQGVRPTLLSQLKHNGTNTPTWLSTTSSASGSTSNGNANAGSSLASRVSAPSGKLDSPLYLLKRSNSTLASATASPSARLQDLQLKQKSEARQASDRIIKKQGYLFFQISKNNQRKSTYLGELVNLTKEFSDLMAIDSFRQELREKELEKFASNLYNASILSRRNRLESARNRDKDNVRLFQYDVTCQNAILKLAELVATGEFTKILNEKILFHVFGTMMQFQLDEDILNLWETGVNMKEKDGVNVANIFLNQDVLSIVLGVAYQSKRFNYEEIKSISAMSVVDGKLTSPLLVERIGQIAISEGDHGKGLDSLETLMSFLEEDPGMKNVLGAMSQLHLSFIGNCKDVTIAKRFFFKATEEQNSLPYNVPLKAPYIVSLFENCAACDDSMEEIINLWSRASSQFVDHMRDQSARLATIHTGMFKVFFAKYPEPTEEALKLYESLFTKAESVDELFLNTLISQMTWTDKSLVEDAIGLFDKFNIAKSLISHRIILKKAGNADFSIEDILSKWTSLLKKLDEHRYSYIAAADWSALRNSTILSTAFSTKERHGLYYSIVKRYGNYMQHPEAALRFLRNWIPTAWAYRQISRITTEDSPVFEHEVEIPQEDFQHLRPNIDYREVTKTVTEAKPRLLD